MDSIPTSRSDLASTGSDRQDERARLKLIRETFEEVLDATKHQDEKIGRFLTAIAFLTTGGITILFTGHLLAPRFDVGYSSWSGGGSYPLLAWATVAFFLCILAAVTLLLLSLSTPLQLPNRGRTHQLSDSRLFFSYIAMEPRDRWAQRWKMPNVAAIEDELFEDYVDEAHNLSERAQLKYAHTDEAAALFIFSLLWLASAVVLAVDVGLHPALSDQSVVSVPVTVPLRFALGVLFSGHAFLQVYAAYNKDRQSTLRTRDAALGRTSALTRQRAVRTLFALLILAPAWTFSLILPSESQLSRRIGALAVVISGLAAMRVLLRRGLSKTSGVRRIALVTVPVAVALVALAFGGIWPIGMACAPAVAISLQVATRSASREQARLRRVKNRPSDYLPDGSSPS